MEIGPNCIGLSLTATGTPTPHFASRSKMRNRGASSDGNDSRSCRTTHRRVGMLGDVAVQDASTAAADDEGAIEHAKDDRWHGAILHPRQTGCAGSIGRRVELRQRTFREAVSQIHSRVSAPESQPWPRGQNSRLCVTAITSFATFVSRLD